MTDELAYEPKRIQVEAGTTVTLVNSANEFGSNNY